MSAATASVADVSRTVSTSRDERNKSGRVQAQCSPMPLPALGTQRIIQGNGTTVGTVISLQCPAKHRLVGGELKCVMDTNSTHWVGETYCKPLSSYEDYGFRVAVLASIVSAGIIFFMSVAFITCCLLDCIKKDKRKDHERESDMWQWEEQQRQDDARSRHKSRNNNNNNSSSQQKAMSLWDSAKPAMCDDVAACRCHQNFPFGPASAYGAATPLSVLPGYDYNQPYFPQSPDPPPICGPPEYSGPEESCQTTGPGLVQVSAEGTGLVWQYGGHHSTFSGRSPITLHEANARNMNPTKEFSIRIISV